MFWICHKLKVFYSIIQLVSVDVMYNFSFFEFSPDVPLHDKLVLGDLFSINIYVQITCGFTNMPASPFFWRVSILLKLCGAFSWAESVFSISFKITRWEWKLFSAIIAYYWNWHFLSFHTNPLYFSALYLLQLAWYCLFRIGDLLFQPFQHLILTFWLPRCQKVRQLFHGHRPYIS